eukprot:251493-Chlamydomonas_euryale.AAC.1
MPHKFHSTCSPIHLDGKHWRPSHEESRPPHVAQSLAPNTWPAPKSKSKSKSSSTEIQQSRIME